MNVKSRILPALIGLVLVCVASAGAMEDHAKPYQGSADFQRIKGLVGVWKGTADMGKGPQEVTVEFAPTAGGSAIVERLFPGTPHEMLDVYFDQGKKLMMTHYCAIGNRPHMALKKSEGKEMKFVLSNDPVIDPIRDTHMHSLKITFTDEDNITQDWVMFKRGKETDVSTFKLTRVRPLSPAPAEIPQK